MIWSKKKVDEDALSYLTTIDQLRSQCPAFEDDRHELSAALEERFVDVLQKSEKKQPVLQEMDQLSKIYAHSEFVNNLFHDELTRIKDKCLADLVPHTPPPARGAALSSIASTQIHAPVPSLHHASPSVPELSRSASHQSRTGAPQYSALVFTSLATHAQAAFAMQSSPRFIAESVTAERSLSPNLPSAASAAAARPAIELLRGPLKRPDRAISKVTFSIIAPFVIFHFMACCFCVYTPCRFIDVTRASSVISPTAFVASWFVNRSSTLKHL
jgi:hypothetical protein